MSLNYSVNKDPDAILDYGFDWTYWLGTDTIVSVLWTVPTGLTLTTQTNSATVATVWLSGGTAGTTYDVGCRITTAAGRVDERTMRVCCVQR